ncbi:MAG: heme-binding domain-containing protein [Candidatus Cyclobacteriaceae bacterium M3_2C_046]
MKIIKIVLIAFAVIILVLQFVPNQLPDNSDNLENDLIAGGAVHPEVANILKTSCYDCHSRQVNYPWYSYVAPVSWLVRKDVEEGVEELDFSAWNTYNKRKLVKILDEIKEEVEEDKMPLPIYTFIHGQAKLDQQQKELIRDWVDEETNLIMGE